MPTSPVPKEGLNQPSLVNLSIDFTKKKSPRPMLESKAVKLDKPIKTMLKRVDTDKRDAVAVILRKLMYNKKSSDRIRENKHLAKYFDLADNAKMIRGNLDTYKDFTMSLSKRNGPNRKVTNSSID